MARLLLACIVCPLALLAAEAQTPEHPLEVGSGVTAPVVTHSVDPDYPHPRFIGKPKPSHVTLSVVVASDGVPQQLTVIKSGGATFDKAAIKAVSQYRFTPGMHDGVPVAVKLQIDIDFRIY